MRGELWLVETQFVRCLQHNKHRTTGSSTYNIWVYGLDVYHKQKKKPKATNLVVIQQYYISKFTDNVRVKKRQSHFLQCLIVDLGELKQVLCELHTPLDLRRLRRVIYI